MSREKYETIMLASINGCHAANPLILVTLRPLSGSWDHVNREPVVSLRSTTG